MQLKPGECLPFEKCDNFRELGGYKGYSEKTVKHGVFYRAPALCQVKTENDVKLFNSLGIKHIFDFRSGFERSAHPDPVFTGATYHPIAATLTKSGEEMNFDLPSILNSGEKGVNEMLQSVSDGYKILPFKNPAYVNMFEKIAKHETPIVFHCTAGKDRTGVAAALILLMLGVSENDVFADYMLTNESRKESISVLINSYGHLIADAFEAEKFIKMIAGVEAYNLQLSLDEVKKQYSSYESYFNREYGINEEKLQALRNIYLE